MFGNETFKINERQKRRRVRSPTVREGYLMI